LGSDFDGASARKSAPADMDTVADLGRVGPALGEMGYGTADIEGGAGGNWLRVLAERCRVSHVLATGDLAGLLK